jgi:uncharacterized membrane protein
MAERLDTPKESRRTLLPKVQVDQDAFGKIAEAIARFMGTPRFLAYMLSLQASYSAPLILLAQNRQADRANGDDTDRAPGIEASPPTSSARPAGANGPTTG